MRLFVITIFFILFIVSQTFAQANNIWICYVGKDGRSFGYIDAHGKKKTSLIFDLIKPADTFHNIVAVHERKDGFYYLLKDGKKIGKDSVYMFDFFYDCESEGKILFHDKKTDRDGFFDKTGSVVVPAIYGWATPFHNSMAMAYKNGIKKCLDSDCEHWTWEGGKTIIINDRNETLISD